MNSTEYMKVQLCEGFVKPITKRCQVSQTYESLYSLISQLSSKQGICAENCLVQYVDGDGEMIAIEDEADWQLARAT